MRTLPILCLLLLLIGCGPNSPKEVAVENATDYQQLQDNTIINLYDAFGEDKEGLTKDFGFSCI
ncbi:hypothetical protein, partial [Flagellimonas flava]|uniref:hypothetical protein n=1 Tax=Flagellimonas flava TaxID=570519 RepID=UPI003D646780